MTTRYPNLNALSWLTHGRVVPVEKRRGYLVVSSLAVANPVWAGASEIVRQFNYTVSKNFNLTNFVQSLIPSGTTCGLAIRYRIGTTVYRYSLYKPEGCNFDAPDYVEQRIAKNFVIEVWSTEGEANSIIPSALNLPTTLRAVPTTPTDMSTYEGMAGISAVDPNIGLTGVVPTTNIVGYWPAADDSNSQPIVDVFSVDFLSIYSGKTWGAVFGGPYPDYIAAKSSNLLYAQGVDQYQPMMRFASGESSEFNLGGSAIKDLFIVARRNAVGDSNLLQIGENIGGAAPYVDIRVINRSDDRFQLTVDFDDGVGGAFADGKFLAHDHGSTGAWQLLRLSRNSATTVLQDIFGESVEILHNQADTGAASSFALGDSADIAVVVGYSAVLSDADANQLLQYLMDNFFGGGIIATETFSEENDHEDNDPWIV